MKTELKTWGVVREGFLGEVPSKHRPDPCDGMKDSVGKEAAGGEAWSRAWVECLRGGGKVGEPDGSQLGSEWKKMKLEICQGQTKGLMGHKKECEFFVSGGFVLKVEDF